MEGTYYKALCPHDNTPVRQQADFSYKCPHCGQTIPSEQLVWQRIEEKKES